MGKSKGSRQGHSKALRKQQAWPDLDIGRKAMGLEPSKQVEDREGEIMNRNRYLQVTGIDFQTESLDFKK